MSELPLIAVTDSASCPRPLAEQIERLTKLTELRPQAVILRAKSLDKAAYRTLALQAQQSCEAAGIALILHSDWQLARELGISKLHLPLALLRQLPACERTHFTWLSTSV
ncbi:thiamine phosphate synthase, partial [Phascolarctobacterium succinatutens]|uniref:thiamine phosphate synthase n=1 Tax=Phascolarctobacterium succinatutens TaxID=626940 RepID=UPI00307969AD